MSQILRIVAPTRLHFGLLHVPVPGLTQTRDGRPLRAFGGLGMMLEKPEISAEITPSTETSFTGTLASRAKQFYDLIPDAQNLRARFHVDGPPEHVGLGVGTALGMALSLAIQHLRNPNSPLVNLHELAKNCQRGQRSGIGIHGFQSGGFLSDVGKLPEVDAIAEMQGRWDFPKEWPVLLIRPPLQPLWHGPQERSAFQRNRTPAAALDTTERLAVLADQVCQAVACKDFDAFSEAIYQYNRVAGEPFAKDQGGPYAGEKVTGVIETLRDWGIRGVGQSSWGPTVFAFVSSDSEVARLEKRIQEWSSECQLQKSRASNTGYRIEFI